MLHDSLSDGVLNLLPQAAHNTQGASRLLAVIKRVDRFLAQRMKKSVSKKKKDADNADETDEDLEMALKKLHALIQDAAVVLSAYTGRGFFKRFLLSSYDEGKFTSLTSRIHETMQVS